MKMFYLSAALVLVATMAHAETATSDDSRELKAQIAQQQKEIDSLNKKLAEIEPASGPSIEVKKPDAVENNPLVKNKLQYIKE